MTQSNPHNKSVQATPTSAAGLPLKVRAGQCESYGVPDLSRWPKVRGA
jgi:hypothetical protein